MNNERFDHIEDKIREAAMQSEPPFDELAWERMEKKLNEESDRRRPIFWWITASVVLLTVFIGAVIMYNVSSAPDSKRVSVPNRGEVGRVMDQQTGFQQPREELIAKAENFKPPATEEEIIEAAGAVQKNVGSDVTSVRRNSRNTNGRAQFTVIPAAAGEDVFEEEIPSTQKHVDSPLPPIEKNADTNMDVDIAAKDVQPESIETIKTGTAEDELKHTDPSAKIPDSSRIDQDEKMKKPRNSRNSKLYFIASAGPEITAVRPGDANGRNISGRFGVGVGYQLNKRLALQTGFYSVAKKYVAGKDDYDPKDASYLSRMNDLVVDANCRVFEIPLSVRYSFPSKGVNTFFASAGVAGVIMKKEDYRFTYTQGTFPYIASYTDEKAFTGNRHLISFFQLSGGLTRSLNNTLSVIAEPYLTIPMQGVGEGRVKLFSAGVQFGIRYNPSKK